MTSRCSSQSMLVCILMPTTLRMCQEDLTALELLMVFVAHQEYLCEARMYYSIRAKVLNAGRQSW